MFKEIKGIEENKDHRPRRKYPREQNEILVALCSKRP